MMNKTLSGKTKLYITAVLCTALWGSAIPAIKIGYSLFSIMSDATADKLLFAGVRFFGAGLLILVPYYIVHKKISLKKATLTHSLIIGLIQTAGQYFFMYIGLSYTTGVNASVFNSVGTLLYVLLAWLIFRNEKTTKLKVLGCAIGFAGILINSLSTQKMGMLTFKGDGFIIFANICVAVGFLYSKHSVRQSNPFLLTGFQMFIGGAVLLILGLMLGGTFPKVDFNGCALLFYLMIVSSVAFSLWTMLLGEYNGALVGMFNFLTPIFGTVFSYILNVLGILNDNSLITFYTVWAVLLSAGGILLSSIENEKESKSV